MSENGLYMAISPNSHCNLDDMLPNCNHVPNSIISHDNRQLILGILRQTQIFLWCQFDAGTFTARMWLLQVYVK